MSDETTDLTGDRGLYGLVHHRLGEARDAIDALNVDSDVLAAVNKKFDSVAEQANSDLTMASRRVERLLDALENGHIPIPEDV